MMTTSASPSGRANARRTDDGDSGGPLPSGVLAAQQLRQALAKGWITTSTPYNIPIDSIQPASMDLRLGDYAWPLRCSFLPDSRSTVEEKAQGLRFDEQVDLRDGATLERDRPYLVPLIEELRLPPQVRAKTNPKSSTGRLDVFTRVITDRNHRFDEIAAGYRGRLYLEIVPRSFAIKISTGIALNQLRVMSGDTSVNDEQLRSVHEESPLLYIDSHPVHGSEISLSDGLFLSLDLAGPAGTTVGYRAKKNSLPIDLSKIRSYDWRDYWDVVTPEKGERIVLEPETFYLLLSAEGVGVPPGYAAEMLAYDPSAGELRTHYAGFFDPGFGFSPNGERHGSRAALEVRARDVSFMVEHRQPVCKLAFERMSATPDVLYGEDLGSNYQGQISMLSKHFADQRAGVAPPPADEDGEPTLSADRLFPT